MNSYLYENCYPDLNGHFLLLKVMQIHNHVHTDVELHDLNMYKLFEDSVHGLAVASTISYKITIDLESALSSSTKKALVSF